MTNRYDSQDDRLPSYGEAGYGRSQPGDVGYPEPGAYGQAQQSGAYGQPQSGGYGQSQLGALGQPQSGGYGPPQPGAARSSQSGGYGQPKSGAYGQSQSGTYGQSQQAAYGQPQQGHGYGQPPGYGQPGQPVQPYGASPPGYGVSPAGYQAGYASPADYASWLTRVAAYLVDSIPQMVLIVIAIVILGKASPATLLLGLVFYLAALGVAIYNRWIKAGQTGQSWGKQLVGVRLIDEETREPIGPLMAFVRDLAHIIDGLICYIGFLFPLWDEKRQTIADKIMHTIVVPAEAPYYPRGAGQSRYSGYPQAPGQYPAGGFPSQGYPQQGYPQGPSFMPNPTFPGEPQDSPYQQDQGRSPRQGYPQGSSYPQGQGYPQGRDYRQNNNHRPGPDNQQGNGYAR